MKILTTIELKEYVYSKFKVIQDEFSEKKLKLNTNFFLGKSDSLEGYYAFTLNEVYHYLFTEKGSIKFDKISTEINEITYWILENEIFNLAMIYARDNRKGEDNFRRQLFSKELELHAKLGEYFFQKKKDDINKILDKNPYSDNKRS